MSEGRFTRGFYESNDGEVHPARIQPETITTLTPNGVGPTTSSIRARVTGSRRGFGLFCRGVRYKWKDDTAPAGYDGRSYGFLPIMTEAAYDALEEDNEIPYLGQTIVITSKVPQKPD